MSPLIWIWKGIELDLYPYLQEKLQQGQIWGLATRERKTPTFVFVTHAGTLYNVILPQIRQHKQTQIMCGEVLTQRWNEESKEYQFCEPYIRQDLPDDTKMVVEIRLKHPKR